MKKKNVLVIHSGYPLGVEAGDKIRTLNMVESLRRMGYNVVLLGFFTRGFSFLKEERKTLPKGLKSILLYSLPDRMRLAKLAEFILAVETFVISKLYSIDVIQAELSASAPCARFVTDIPLITDFHSDLVPELEMGGYSQDVIEHAASENRFALKYSDRIISVSDKLFENLQVYGKMNANHFILPCNFNIEPFMGLNLDVRNRLRAEYGISDRIVLCYSGAFRVWQCIKETLEVVIRLRELNPSYYLCIFTNDDTTPFMDLLKLLEGNYMVKGLGRMEVPAYLSMADAGFVLRADSLVNINSSPTKTSEYLAAGAMVIATKYAGDAPKQIKESSCGVVFDNLLISDAEIAMLNEQLIYYAENYDLKNRVWSSNEVKLADLYKSLNI